MPSILTIGLSLSLSGTYAPMGRQAEAGLRLLVSDVNAAGGARVGGTAYELALECHDDRSDPARCAEIYHALCFENPADLILGPYSSRLTRAAAPVVERAGKVIVNHGGAADDLYEQKHRMIVGVLSPASEYLVGFAALLAKLKFWRKRVAILSAPTPFATWVAAGVERALKTRGSRRRGVRLRLKFRGEFDPTQTPERLFPALKRNRVNSLVSAGSYDQDVAVMRALVASGLNLPVLACVAAGVRSFAAELGDHADGILGPSQWEEHAAIVPEFGPSPAQFVRRMQASGRGSECDYIAAQAYAAGLLLLRALEAAHGLDQLRLREAFSDLETRTFFGDFSINRVTGRQVGHRVLLVQWHEGHKVIVEPAEEADSGALEFPSGWRLLLAGLRSFRIKRAGEDDESDDGPGPT